MKPCQCIGDTGLFTRPAADTGLIAPFGRIAGRPSAYVKIADGCNHTCAFCTIPSIKGPSVSKRPIAVLEEIQSLVAGGTREAVLISQNTGAYGQDLEPRMTLAALLGVAMRRGTGACRGCGCITCTRLTSRPR